MEERSQKETPCTSKDDGGWQESKRKSGLNAQDRGKGTARSTPSEKKASRIVSTGRPGDIGHSDRIGLHFCASVCVHEVIAERQRVHTEASAIGGLV
eukprot:5182345-Pleurochrysis_carterae.AAC.2